MTLFSVSTTRGCVTVTARNHSEAHAIGVVLLTAPRTEPVSVTRL